nr:probable glutathione S-transferase [Ipomoea batatas]
MFRTSGEEHERAVKDSLEMLKTIEEEALALALGGGKKFFGGDEIGMVDIAFGGIVHWLEAIEDVVGVKLLEPAECFPKLHAWMMNFKESPLIKENLPDKNGGGYFFSTREVKNSRGNLFNKAIGKDKKIAVSGVLQRLVGMKKTLAYYKGKPSNGSRTNWIMHKGTSSARERYFFSRREVKNDSGNRCNRATGKDKKIIISGEPQHLIGMKKTLVYYKGKPSNGSRIDWILHKDCTSNAPKP